MKNSEFKKQLATEIHMLESDLGVDYAKYNKVPLHIRRMIEEAYSKMYAIPDNDEEYKE